MVCNGVGFDDEGLNDNDGAEDSVTEGLLVNALVGNGVTVMLAMADGKSKVVSEYKCGCAQQNNAKTRTDGGGVTG
eukprot:scaffold5375_cov218-Alexandrium_tamarense.AAC.3